MLCRYCYTLVGPSERICPRCGHGMPHADAPGPSVSPSRPYHPSGKCSSSGLALLLGGATTASLAAGALHFHLAGWVDLPLIAPLLLGIAIGALLAVLVTAGRCRNPRLAAVCGLLAGPLACSFHLSLSHGASETAAARAASRAGQRAGKTRSAWGARAERARAPEARPTAGGLPGGDPAAWWLFAGGMGIMSLAAAGLARSAALRPFCEPCGHWHTRVRVTRVAPAQRTSLLEAFEARDWARIRYIPAGGAVSRRNRCDLVLAHCPDCSRGTIALLGVKGGRVQPPAYTVIEGEPAAALAALAAQRHRP